MSSVSPNQSNGKVCRDCGDWHPFTEYYVRSGVKKPTRPGHYLSNCIPCMKARSKKTGYVPPTEPYAQTERIAINYLHANGIPCLPGKAVAATDVDVVAFGCVWIEVKYAREQRSYKGTEFRFTTTGKQQQRGMLAHVVMLVCEYMDGHTTYHLLDAQDGVFYKDGLVKTALTVRVGSTTAMKDWSDRMVLTHAALNEAQDDIGLIDAKLAEIREALKHGEPLAVSARGARPKTIPTMEASVDADAEIASLTSFVTSLHRKPDAA